MNAVFITGGTGYIGTRLIQTLLDRGHAVHALVRSGSEGKLPDGTVAVAGNALDATTFAASIPPDATVVHLVGTPHPSPSKAAEFKRVDLVSIQQTMAAVRGAAPKQIVYVSVAHPAPVMRAYIEVRQAGETLIRESGIPSTILRPWYVLGPGHYWPYTLVPIYAILRWLPPTRSGAERLGLVTHHQMVAALAEAVENPPSAGVRIIDVPAICRALHR